LRFSDPVEVRDVDQLIVEAESGVGVQVLALVQHVGQVAEAPVSGTRDCCFYCLHCCRFFNFVAVIKCVINNFCKDVMHLVYKMTLNYTNYYYL
jgi:hypothetical protein